MTGLGRERWLLISKQLDAVLELPEAQRVAYLTALQREHPAICAELKGILAAGGSQAYREFLAGTPEAATELANKASFTGTRLGPYIIEAAIGSGGMGSVWRARRADGQFEGQVAIKLLNAALIGQPAEQRFRREGSMLAALRHPHIAQLFDAGVAPTGQAFLVLEYIDGARIDRYCNDHFLSLDARIHLFLDVLSAVSFAHSHLIVHRDLKPENILVTTDGSVKLLDFGIAALIPAADGSPATVRTLEASAAFTPAYATPEQLLNGPITTANDVYALGLILYLLLAGQHPYADGAASAVERVKAITERDAPLMSGTARDVALARALRGDLDNIVAKALRRVPTERYATVDALAVDLRRYLHKEPISARPATLSYRVGKFVARYRAGVLAATLGLMVLIGLSAYAWIQRDQALIQARRANAQAYKAGFVKDFLLDIFNSNSLAQDDPQKAQNATALQLLDRAAKRLESTRSADPDTDDELLDTVGSLYQDLRVVDTAVKLRQHRVELARTRFTSGDHRIVDALLSYAEVLYESAGWKSAIDPLSEAEARLETRGDRTSVARANLDRMLAEYWRATDINKSLMYAHRAVWLFRDRYPDNENYASALRIAGYSEQNAFHFAAAESFFHEAVQVQMRLNAPETDRVQSVITLADARSDLLMDTAAANGYRQGIEMSRRIKGPAHIDTLQSQMRFGAFLRGTTRYRESIDLLRATETQAVTALGEQETFHLPAIRFQLANSLLSWGDPQSASPLLERALAVRERTRPNSIYHAVFLLAHAKMLTQQGRFQPATDTLDRVAAIYARIGTKAMKTVLPLYRAQNFLAQGRRADVLAVLDETERLISTDEASDARVWRDPLHAQQFRLVRALAELESRHYSIAETILNGLAAETITPGRTAYFAAFVDERNLLLGRLYAETGRAAKALPLLRGSLAWRRAHLNPEGPQMLEAITALAEVTAMSGSRTDSAALLAQADRIATKLGPLGPQFTEPLRRAHRAARAAAARRSSRNRNSTLPAS